MVIELLAKGSYYYGEDLDEFYQELLKTISVVLTIPMYPQIMILQKLEQPKQIATMI